MPRYLSNQMVQALYAQETGEVFVILLTITHDALPDPIRVSSEYQEGAIPFRSQGYDFPYFPFMVELPLDAADETSQTRIRFDNVNGAVIDAVRSLGTTPPRILMQIVLASTPDHVEVSFDLQLLDIDYDEQEISATIGWENVLTEPYPADSVTPQFFPGLFR